MLAQLALFGRSTSWFGCRRQLVIDQDAHTPVELRVTTVLEAGRGLLFAQTGHGVANIRIEGYKLFRCDAKLMDLALVGSKPFGDRNACAAPIS